MGRKRRAAFLLLLWFSVSNIIILFIQSSLKLFVTPLPDQQRFQGGGQKKADKKETMATKETNDRTLSDDTTKKTADTTKKTVVQRQHFKSPVVTLRPDRCNGCFHSNFAMLIDQPDLCTPYGVQSIFIIFLILSAYQHSERRQAIRDTWASVTGNNTSSFRYVFVLGNTQDQTRQKAATQENRVHQDLLVSDFVDSYSNLTLKTLVGLRWAVTRCRHAMFFMKVHDDVFVNPENLVQLLNSEGDKLRNRLGGRCRTQPGRRNPVWQRFAAFRAPTHLPICESPVHLSSMEVAEKIVNVSKDVPFFQAEDVYVALCVQAAGLRLLNIQVIETSPKDDDQHFCVIQLNYAAWHSLHPSPMRLLWKLPCRGQFDMEEWLAFKNGEKRPEDV